MTEGHYIKPYEKTPGFSGDILFTKKDISEDILNLDAK